MALREVHAQFLSAILPVLERQYSPRVHGLGSGWRYTGWDARGNARGRNEFECWVVVVTWRSK